MLNEYVMLYIGIPPSLKASQSLISLGATMLPPRSKLTTLLCLPVAVTMQPMTTLGSPIVTQIGKCDVGSIWAKEAQLVERKPSDSLNF